MTKEFFSVIGKHPGEYWEGYAYDFKDAFSKYLANESGDTVVSIKREIIRMHGRKSTNDKYIFGDFVVVRKRSNIRCYCPICENNRIKDRKRNILVRDKYHRTLVLE